MALRVITKQLQDLERKSIQGVCITPETDNMYDLRITIVGPSGTPYENGIFFGTLEIPQEYPLKPPKFKFTTKIYHPNIADDGRICMAVLKDDWNPAVTLERLLKALVEFLTKPNIEDPLKSDVANEYKNDYKKFCATATSWTQKYAM